MPLTPDRSPLCPSWLLLVNRRSPGSLAPEAAEVGRCHWEYKACPPVPFGSPPPMEKVFPREREA